MSPTIRSLRRRKLDGCPRRLVVSMGVPTTPLSRGHPQISHACFDGCPDNSVVTAATDFGDGCQNSMAVPGDSRRRVARNSVGVPDDSVTPQEETRWVSPAAPSRFLTPSGTRCVSRRLRLPPIASLGNFRVIAGSGRQWLASMFTDQVLRVPVWPVRIWLAGLLLVLAMCSRRAPQCACELTRR